jgi:hypothetical protein
MVSAELVEPIMSGANVRLAGETLAPGAPAPVPVKATICGLPPALSVSVSDPERVPVFCGVNTTAMLQEAPAASDVPQLFVTAKSPRAPILVTANADVPLLVRVTLCGALLVPTV